MKTIEAFKCDKTGRIFEDARDARRSEFIWMMRSVSGHLPSPEDGQLSSEEIMEWLADKIASGIYPSAFPELRDALAYFDENRSAIERR